MKTRWFPVLALGVSLGLATPALLAGPKGQHKDQGKKQAAERHDAQHEDSRWEQREGFEYRVYGLRDNRPPGWNRGKKAGWRDCGPQSRRFACYTYIHAGHRYFYYHDDDARIVVRRVAINVNVSVVR